jgi:hypothetical protein
MRTLSALLACSAATALLSCEPLSPSLLAAAQKKDVPAGKKSEQLPVRLGKIPAIALAPRPALDARKTARIKECIAKLAAIDAPDFGFSPTLSGKAFLPLPGQHHSRVMLLTDHRLKSSEALRTLVEMGPDSLPFLLDALDDRTPTKLEIEHRSGFGGMWFANDLRGNPVNPIEVRVLGVQGQRQKRGENRRKWIRSYTVKVGDICMVAVGQIVGRGYQAVRYQPSAIIVINSPTEDANLRNQVRDIWWSWRKDAAKRLFESLLLDYATEGKWKEGESLGRWSVGSNLQVEAAMRLLYYFPKETVPMIARRLKGLRIEKRGEERDAWARREVANGARTVELVKAVSWCKAPAIRDAVRAIFEQTGDLAILLAALPGLDKADGKLIRTRIDAFLKQTPRDEGGAYGDGYNLLVAAGQHLEAEARPLFRRYLEDAGAMRCYTMCKVLQVTKKEWASELLAPLLADRRAVAGYTHLASRTNRNNTVPIRVCDAAAQTLSQHYPELMFEMIGTDQELDRQIQVIRAQLARKK